MMIAMITNQNGNLAGHLSLNFTKLVKCLEVEEAFNGAEVCLYVLLTAFSRFHGRLLS